MQPSEHARTMEVCVWHARLDLDEAALDALAATLSDDERARAERFVFARDRSRFIAARGVLRRLLGARLGLAPSRLRFAYGAQGKPSLSQESSEAQVSFSVAHSRDRALVAVASGAPIGADIEVLRPLPSAEAIAERVFSPDELAQLRSLPSQQREVAFYLGWTRKEAYIKALGTGLAHPLDAFSVSFTPGAPAQLLAGHVTDAGPTWLLRDLSRLPDYAAAIVVGAYSDDACIDMKEFDAS